MSSIPLLLVLLTRHVLFAGDSDSQDKILYRKPRGYEFGSPLSRIRAFAHFGECTSVYPIHEPSPSRKFDILFIRRNRRANTLFLPPKHRFHTLSKLKRNGLKYYYCFTDALLYRKISTFPTKRREFDARFDHHPLNRRM